MFCDLVERLASDLARVERNLVTALTQLDRDAIRAETHTLVAIAGAVGAERLRARSEALNGCAHNDDLVLLRPLGREVLSQLDRLIIPLAVVAAVMLLGSQEPGRMGDWMLALTIAWVATAIILFSATYLQKWLGTRVLTAIERLMGMVIVAISVQMLLDGIASYLRAGT